MDNISIITPAYKAVNFIDDYIKSFENQKNIYNISYELIIGVDGCIETKEKLLSKKLPDYVKIFWFEYNYGPYIVKNSIVNESKWPYIIFFDIDDIALPNFIDINIEERANYDILRQSIQYSNKPAYGIIGLWKQTWEKIGGYQPWKCGADSELLERSKLMEFTQGRTNEKTFYRREHENQLTKAKETFKGSSLREDYKKLVGKYKGKIDPITAYYKRTL